MARAAAAAMCASAGDKLLDVFPLPLASQEIEKETIQLWRTWGPSFGVSIFAVPSGNKQSEAVLKSIGREMLASKHSRPVDVQYTLKDNVVVVEKHLILQIKKDIWRIQIIKAWFACNFALAFVLAATLLPASDRATLYS